MLDVYHWAPAADSLKVLIALGEKMVDYRSHRVDVMAFEQYAPEYLRLAPLGQVPVLVHDGEVLNDPLLLLEYIEDAFPRPPLATLDAAGWYGIQEWIRFVDAEFNAAVNLVGWHSVMLPAMTVVEQEEFNRRLSRRPVREEKAGWSAVVRDAESTEDRLENARGRIREAIVRMEEVLDGSPWLAGEEFSIADIAAFAHLRTLPQLLPEVINGSDTPGLLNWIKTINARPAVATALAGERGAQTVGVYLPE